MSSSPPSKRMKRSTDTISDPEKEGSDLLEWLISPCPVEQFYKKHWEREPLLIKRQSADYYQKGPFPLFTLADAEQAMKDQDLLYGQNIDITNYRDGKRVTLNEADQKVTHEAAMKRFHDEKCTLRILHPQEFNDTLYQVCSLLQEWFGAVVGANVYITPPGAQGFAPHYDDVDVFIVQVEGSKRWRLYHPITPEMELPEVSSGNFEQEDIGEPFLDVLLEAGDLLYFPRGVIHQAETDGSDVHSTHVTLSTVQKWTWYHYLVHALPAALRIAFEENVAFRQALPRQFQQYMGVLYSDREEDPQREEFMNHVAALAQESLQYLPFDPAADRMVVDFLHDSLPPVVSETPSQSLTLKTRIRLKSRNAVRIVSEDDSLLLYYSTKNTRIYHELEPQFLEFPLEASEALDCILMSYPRFVVVDDLPLEFDDDKIGVVEALQAANVLLLSNNTD